MGILPSERPVPDNTPARHDLPRQCRPGRTRGCELAPGSQRPGGARPLVPPGARAGQFCHRRYLYAAAVASALDLYRVLAADAAAARSLRQNELVLRGQLQLIA